MTDPFLVDALAVTTALQQLSTHTDELAADEYHELVVLSQEFLRWTNSVLERKSK